MNINYQKELDKLIDKFEKDGIVPTLLLHSCCAPCSSYVLEYLSNYFEITIFYYNPNINPAEEYDRRVIEQRRLIQELNDGSNGREAVKYKIDYVVGDYEPEKFFDIAKGLEKEKEGGSRCFNCYELRLNEAAIIAKEGGYDYFTTTLSISPHKNADKLNEIGRELEERYGVRYLYSDFKKKNGFKRSIELSKEHELYRQDYCGCVYSKIEMLEREKLNSTLIDKSDN
jgi:predicted adenine nucleotide alpha hydrolase (AANH) superfamily ATPase